MESSAKLSPLDFKCPRCGSLPGFGCKVIIGMDIVHGATMVSRYTHIERDDLAAYGVGQRLSNA